MKIVRELKLPGRREYESSGWSVTLDTEVIGIDMKGWDPAKIQQTLHDMSREAQIRVIHNFLAEGFLSTEEAAQRIKPFMGPPPEFMKVPR